MVVGQGPGSHEDLKGRPFLGKAGKLLRMMLTDAGIDPDSVYYTNATRCRTEEDAKPTHEQIEWARPALIEEIHRVKPTVIIALGDPALQSLCKKSGITGKRGQPHALHAVFDRAIEVWPTYHPAFVLRVPAHRATVVADLRKVRDRFRPDDQVPWSWANEKTVSLEGRVAWDIETDYDKAVKGSGEYLTQMAMADANGAVVYTPGDIKDITGQTVTHNGWEFDVPQMRSRGYKVPWGRDTMVMGYLADENQPLGLEALCVKYLGVKGWKEAKDAPVGSAEFAMYNARDAYYTRRLHDTLETELGPRVAIADKIILPAYIALRSGSERGTYLDQKEIERFMPQFTGPQAEAKVRAQQWVENPGSQPQVLAALQKEGYDIQSADKAILQSISHPLATAVLDYRTATKSLATLRAYARMERAHPTYKLWRTLTGRSSASRPNVQNLDRQFKSIFSAPPGFVRLSADYDSVEFRLSAWYANETGILARFQTDPHWDPHTFFAALFYGIPEPEVDKKGRQIAKSANYSQLFIGNGFTMVNYAAGLGIILDPVAAGYIHIKWHETFPAFRPWYGRVGGDIINKGYVETATGRRRHFGDVSMMNRFNFEEAKRQGVNAQPQSLAFDLGAIAMSYVNDRLPFTDFIHDSLAVEVKDDPATIAAAKEVMTYAMTEHAPKFIKEHFGADLSTIPLTIDFTETRHT